ncbi:MAG: cysteine desulfurase [Alphaproteobacteria bacterium]
MSHSIYLDHNATTPLRPEAIAAMTEVLGRVGNPSSVHAFGRAARKVVEDARERVADLVAAEAGQVIFTSGGTEANAQALRGLGAGRILASAIEHASLLAAVPGVETIPVDRDGVIDLAALESLLRGAAAAQRPTLVAVMLANNETGVVQPVAEAVAIARRHGALVHCDAVQAAGKIAVDLAGLGVDSLSLSAHKFGGPQGVGALVLAPGVVVQPLVSGGGQERRRRAGTENVAGIAGFGAAAALAASPMHGERMASLSGLRDRLEGEVLRIAPTARVFGSRVARLLNTSCFALPGLEGAVQVMALDLAGIAVAAGAACSSGRTAPSHVLTAQGATATEAASAIRVSLGWTSTGADVDGFLAAWRALVERTVPISYAKSAGFENKGATRW